MASAGRIALSRPSRECMTGSRPCSLDFKIAANSQTALLLYQPFTKENSGTNYPVGLSTVAFDKKTKSFVYSNSFAGDEQNNHANGYCEVVIRD
jgi:hypothetical protein